MRDWTDFRKQFNAMLDAALPDADADAKEIARLESELRAARRSLEYAQAECNALLGEVRRLRWEGTRGDWLRELWTALGVPAQAQALAEVKRLQRQASEVLRATGAQSHEEAMATVRALYHAAASGAEVAGELVAVRRERDALRRMHEEVRRIYDPERDTWSHEDLAPLMRAYNAIENAGNTAGQRAPEGGSPLPPSADTGIAPAAVEVSR